ncbi:bifunctional cobalt-precorrin-7 (C(5))-methyltransferase/cobalt-precorrin-6B (C(15))-methyltransferase, partial [Labilibacter marinus]|uniref:bifunctional cobalt-precorrin-7 (C(5))-methyltransferase/cobalt-precorrin-6B (C(15))-methyltransferase n=1 Tax=Labilibacter marinus TaxID=1477105 RepID=UPI00094F75A6
PPLLSDKAKEWMVGATFFTGGKRHHELVKNFLPKDYVWEDVKVPISAYIDSLQNTNKEWVVLASGDPYFYGIAITLKRYFPDAEIVSLPTFNSLQMLAHQKQVAYGEYRVVTLTGRPWNKFDKALIEGEERIALLTDKKKTPAVIAQRMLDFGYDNYQMVVGENMGGEKERIFELSVKETSEREFAAPNCVYLTKNNKHIPIKGIPEGDLETLEGRPKMITKMPVKVTSLALMQLQSKKVFWDVGACSGSMSIEAKLMAPQLDVFAFEIREESRGIIERNTKQFQTPGIEAFIGDFNEVSKVDMPKPDAVFLGGYGGQMHQVLDHIHQYLQENGVLAFNAVSDKSQQEFEQWCDKNNYLIQHSIDLKVNDFNEIRIYCATQS